MQSMMSNLEPEQIAAMSGGKLTPEMAKMAIDMVKQMSDTDMQNMLGMMSSLESESTAKTTATTSQSMPTTSGSSSTSRSTSLTGSSTSASSFTRSDIQNLTSLFPASTPDLSSISPEMQEQMRQQMKDPMMTQVIVKLYYVVTEVKGLQLSLDGRCLSMLDGLIIFSFGVFYLQSHEICDILESYLIEFARYCNQSSCVFMLVFLVFVRVMTNCFRMKQIHKVGKLKAIWSK
jgi:hypothetical protein